MICQEKTQRTRGALPIWHLVVLFAEAIPTLVQALSKALKGWSCFSFNKVTESVQLLQELWKAPSNDMQAVLKAQVIPWLLETMENHEGAMLVVKALARIKSNLWLQRVLLQGEAARIHSVNDKLGWLSDNS